MVRDSPTFYWDWNYSWQVIKAACEWNISDFTSFFPPLRLAFWCHGAALAELVIFIFCPWALKPGGSHRLCRRTVRKRSIFSTEGGKMRRPYVHLFQPYWLPFPPALTYICGAWLCVLVLPYCMWSNFVFTCVYVCVCVCEPARLFLSLC